MQIGDRIRVETSRFYFIGTYKGRTPNGGIELTDAEHHNPADTSVVPHCDNVRIAPHSIHSISVEA